VLEDPQRSLVECWLGSDADEAVWAFGYKMDNMKCESWHEARFPILVGLEPEAQGALFAQAQLMIAASEAGLSVLKRSLKRAWSDEGKKGDTSAAERRFLHLTETIFYRLLNKLKADLSETAEGAAAREAIKLEWMASLKFEAFKVFAEYAESSDARTETLRVMQRIAEANRQLGVGLHIELLKGLNMAPASAPKKSKSSNRSKAA